MRPYAALRASGALWFVPGLFLVTGFHALISYTPRTGYPAGDISAGSNVIYLAGPILGAFAALTWRGVDRFHGPFRSNRSGIRILLNRAAPLLLGGPLVATLSVLVLVRTIPTDSVSLTILAIDWLCLWTCVLLGIAAALIFPTVVAVPVTAFGLFWWIAIVPSRTSELLHNMTPTMAGCCAPSVQPASVAVRAVTLLCGIVCLGVVALFMGRRWSVTSRFARLAVMVLVLAGGFGLAAASLKASGEELTLAATEPRTTPLECSVESGIQVCLWPESEPQRSSLVGAARDLNEIFDGWGFPRIDSVGQSGDRTMDRLNVATTSDAGREALTRSMIKGYVRQHIGCSDDWDPAMTERTAFLMLVSEVASADEIEGDLGPEALQGARQIMAGLDKADDSPRAWFFGDGNGPCGATP